MTMHTRYRAAMQRALGAAVFAEMPLPEIESAAGTAVLTRLEADHRFTLTALPVDERPTEPTEADPVLGPCGDPALVPKVEIRRVETADGDRVEIALLSSPYCWRVRSWWTPEQAAVIADEIHDAALVAGRPAAPTREQVTDELEQMLVDGLETMLGIDGKPAMTPRELAEGATERVVALLSRSAAEPPKGIDVLRGLLDHALAEWLHGGVEEFSRWDDTDWADSTWTDAEKVELRAAVERVAAEPKEHGDGR